MKSLDEKVRARAETDGVVLDLSNAYLGDDGCAALCRLLRQYPAKRVLDLRGNRIQADGAVHLAAFLKQSNVITSINLEWNCVGVLEHGLEALSAALAMNTTLTHLDLRNNSIGPDGAALLAAGLKRNRTLQELDLRWNDMGSLGGHALSEMLQDNHTLLRLHLMGNNVAMATMELVEACLRQLPVLHDEAASTDADRARKDDDDARLLLTYMAETGKLQDEVATTKKHIRLLEDQNETSERVIQKLHADVRLLTDERDRYQMRELEALKTADDYKTLYNEADARRRKDYEEHDIAKHKLEQELLRAKDQALQAELSHERVFEQLENERKAFARERDYLEGSLSKAKASLQTAQIECERLQKHLLDERSVAEHKLADARSECETKVSLAGRRFEATQGALEDQTRGLQHQLEAATRELLQLREANDMLQSNLLQLKLGHEKDLSSHLAKMEKEAKDRFERSVVAIEAQLADVRSTRVALERDVETHLDTIERLRNDKTRLRAEHETDRASLERTIGELRATAQAHLEADGAKDLELARLQRKLDQTMDRMAHLEATCAQTTLVHDARVADLQARYEVERAKAEDASAQRLELEGRLQSQIDALRATLADERSAADRRLQAFAARVTRFVAQAATGDNDNDEK
ncbi:hypothetical protein SPRG_19039 [Saprolegnia parasitica CBS 223.65]|uniref:Uncharacterized protein n=1 Tax=Saprolegnia parasitica (strain CBS 223.65) TaxID=695850 RepID=A0A067D5D4_SAPPC|nr:hypothetical protein SPRG_19039 [Saprolegnia parasitica CBS 223.65]KDO34197.1 hypothetical protein SPRG_19039 [Saprolegnia parasitica CBS 223.65]|eukprot:XP_012195237.1 hypothetical protein SPRG_19039 [Saprolegnia parasitica CBS 223.65]